MLCLSRQSWNAVFQGRTVQDIQVYYEVFEIRHIRAFSYVVAFPHASSVLVLMCKLLLSVSAKKGLVKDIYRAANRITLYLLGRENQPMEELLRVLTLIMNNQSSILSEANPDRKFFCCLCLDLLPFLLDDNQQIRRTTINVSFI